MYIFYIYMCLLISFLKRQKQPTPSYMYTLLLQASAKPIPWPVMHGAARRQVLDNNAENAQHGIGYAGVAAL